MQSGDDEEAPTAAAVAPVADVVGELIARYLDSVKRELLNEHHLEDELRLAHLADCLTRPKPVELAKLRDPVRHDAEAFSRLRRQRRTGQPADEPTLPVASYVHAPSGRIGLDHLDRCLDLVELDDVPGELVTCGEGRGGAGIFLRAHLAAHRTIGRDVWVAGRFRAAADDRSAPDAADGLGALRPDLNTVRDAFDRFGVLDERTHFLQGDLAATLPDASIEQVALLHATGDAATVGVALEHLGRRLAVGGFLVVDEADAAVEAVVAAYVARHGSAEPLRRIGAHGLGWRKTAEATSGPQGPSPALPHAARTPLAPAVVGTSGCDLSMVVVVHDMGREAVRTLHSLSRSYQEGIDDLDYEVIVVENGTAPDRRLGAAMVERHGPEFRYLDLGADATSSPTPALNRGIAASRGAVVGLMVDGAHVVTPGVLRQAMTGGTAYSPAVVAVQPFYVGPGQQGDAMRLGYDQAVEDELFERVGWPSDGYRLFEISHFQGDRDWFDGLWESNCLFVPRPILEQVGGFDEGFDEAGGGYTNLDAYERLAAAPGVRLVTILGEGSFHQVHGGTTTNQADPVERRRRVFSFGQRYAELRGRSYSGPEKQVHYVGSFHGDAARRTRARRLTGRAFEPDAAIEGTDGPSTTPSPIPDDLRDAFVAAYWRSQAWRETTWLGRKVPNAPTDLVTYQELVAEVRPRWIIETGTRAGGRALFLAGVCDLIGTGQVISIDTRPSDELPEHPRISYLTGRAHDDDVVAQVRALVGPGADALVILGTRGAQRRMHREFEQYAPFVPKGSYVVLEHTVLNGYPVNAAFGPGPFEALRRLMNLRGDFIPDPRGDRHGLSFNRGGVLRRVR